MDKKYEKESEGQIDFFKNYGIPYDEDNSILVDNTDGVYNGNLLEFKLSINNLNSVLFQAIKYLSRMRIKGESVPKTILLIDLNARKAYEYESIDYIDDIQKTYVGAASKNNDNFTASKPNNIYNYKNMLESNELKKQLIRKKSYPEEMYIPIDINETCIVGWAERYYREKPTAGKGDFLGDSEGKVPIIGEIREPRHFKGLINPYIEETNAKFKYLMDCLNDRLKKKDLGAFYTPTPYAKKAAELVQMAVNRAIDAGKKDYIVLDRCSGCGSLEMPLIDLYDKNGDEIISHAVISTYEYYEYRVLSELLGDKVRDIIPPTEADVVYESGLIANADAMSKEYLENPIINQYVENEDCAIIMFENPPYRDVSSNSTGTAKTNQDQKSFVLEEMKKEKSGAMLNELTNRFVWSSFKYYMRTKDDYYILFSPVKYWKQYSLANKKMIKGFLFNRNHFHATASAISCILWSNIDDEATEELILKAYDINENEDLVFEKDVKVKKVHNNFAKNYYDKRTFKEDTEDGICCNLDGTERYGNKTVRVKKLYNNNIVGYMQVCSYNFDVMSRSILRGGQYNGNGFFLRNDNYIEKLPLFVAKLIPLDNWYEKDIYATTSDGGDRYTTDNDFLKSCLIYTCLSNQNKCLSFTGSDGRYYKNELCFDKDTLASKDLKNYTLEEAEEELLKLWNNILEEARTTKNYKADLSYGVYQIIKDLNTYDEVKVGKSKTRVYHYPQLNGNLETLRVKLKEYYKTHIWDKMFEYELVK